MKKQVTKKLIQEFSENFSLTSEEFENAMQKNISSNQTLEVRWVYMKTDEIISDLDHIVAFTRQSSRNIAICDEIDTIVSKLRRGEYDILYGEIVGIMRKYLNGVQKFISESSMRGVILYKKLFESILIAMVREVRVLEINAS